MAGQSSAEFDFDVASFRAYLSEAFGHSNEFCISKVNGGQSNPTFYVTYAQQRLVMRKKPAGQIVPGAHAIEREYRVLQALHLTEIPVPRAISYVDDSRVIGTPFYLMERVEGRIFSDCSLPNLNPHERRATWMAMADTLALLHSVKPRDVGLGDFGKPGSYYARQISRWTRQLNESGSQPVPALDRLAKWVGANVPKDDGIVTLAHGDFRMGNLMFDKIEPRVVAILDWELSTLGHPCADLAFCILPWHTSPNEYGGILGLNRAELGIPSEEEFVERYLQRTSAGVTLLPFHKAFALFRFAVIFVGIADRVRAGNAAGGSAIHLTHLPELFAKRALELID